MRPEHLLQTHVGKFVRSAVTVPHFFECYDRSRDHSGTQHLWEANRHIKAGTPDTALVVDGRVYRVELKAPGNKPTEKQLERIEELKAAGACAGWAITVEGYAVMIFMWGIPLAPNWRIQAQHHDALIASRLAKAPTPKKASKPRAAKPTASRVRRVQEIMTRYLPPEPVFTGVKK